MQIKNLMKHYYTSTIKVLKFKRLTKQNVGKYAKLMHCWLKCKMVNVSWKPLG